MGWIPSFITYTPLSAMITISIYYTTFDLKLQVCKYEFFMKVLFVFDCIECGEFHCTDGRVKTRDKSDKS